MGYISIDPDAFRAWLLCHGEQEVVGVAASRRRCPLACFLNAWGVKGVRYEVGGARVWVYDVSTACLAEEAPLPAWAERFVGLVDDRVGVGGVTRSAAVGLLERALASRGEGNEAGE